MISLIYKFLRKVVSVLKRPYDQICTAIIFLGNNISYTNFRSIGLPYVSVALGSTCIIGKNLKMNNGAKGNPIGCFQPCTIFVNKGAYLKIGNNLGMSQSALICHGSITIGNDVKLGGGVCIYDTDFHSLNHNDRLNSITDMQGKVILPVVIGNNVFIGAHSIILKGVNIGDNSIIGAGSIVTKTVPKNEVWAGNPAKFIRKI